MAGADVLPTTLFYPIMENPEGAAALSSTAAALNAELAGIQQQIDRATTAYQPNLLTRAADICAEAGENARALAYYGQAIDGYLAGGRHHAASAVCRKILQLSPGAVRAHCTLAWLALAREETRQAAQEIRTYVEAARAAGQAQLATRQLGLLARAASARPVREAIGRELLQLERSEESEAFVRGLYAAGEEAGDLEHDASDIWAQALRAVRMTPYDLAGAGDAARGTGPAQTLAEALRADATTPPALREVLEQSGRAPA